MPTELRLRRERTSRAPTPLWLQLALLLFFVASFVMMLAGYVASGDALLLASP